MSKQKSAYVVVDWGTWGIDVQLSTKIVIKDQLGIIREGDACSLQGIDPVHLRHDLRTPLQCKVSLSGLTTIQAAEWRTGNN